MNDNDFEEQEKNSLINDISKQGLSKYLKTLPLKNKLIIFGVIFGIFFFLLIFVTVITVPTIMLFAGDDSKSSNSDYVYIENDSEGNYWWPIGGSEIITDENGIKYAPGAPSTTIITSGYDLNRVLEGETEAKSHRAIDISDEGSHYIIAVADGKVHTALSGCDNNGYVKNNCNGGWGNYVVIEHANNVYTLYAHMFPNSITVSMGDNVKQGQVIGIMGHSGSSDGKHLHFQVEVGTRSNSSAVNPLDWVNPDNPRPESKQTQNQGEEAIKMLHSWESAIYADEDNYLIYDDNGAAAGGTLTVGRGITLFWNREEFAKRGVDIQTLAAGDKLPISIVDEIEAVVVAGKRTEIDNILNNNNLVLEDYQKDALLIRYYNTYISGFVNAYNQYGNTQALYDNYLSSPTGDASVEAGLKRRRQAEWKLFHEGIYTLNS